MKPSRQQGESSQYRYRYRYSAPTCTRTRTRYLYLYTLLFLPVGCEEFHKRIMSGDGSTGSTPNHDDATPSTSTGNNAQRQDLHSLSLAYQTYMKHDDEEIDHFVEVTRAFRQYAAFAMSHWANQQYRLHSLPESQRQVLPDALKRDTADFNRRASEFKEAAIRNQFCLDCILRHAGVPHSQEITSIPTTANDAQISKVSSVLKSLARDWSADGRAEREMAYSPIIQHIQKYLPILPNGVVRPKICVPGSGTSHPYEDVEWYHASINVSQP